MRPQLGKQKLLGAATELFESQGYFATTIEQITKRAGVSKGLVYNYFSSKEELLVALLEAATSRMTAVAETLIPRASIEQSLSVFLDRYLSFLESERMFLKLQLTLMLMPELHQIVRQPQQERAAALLASTSDWFRQVDVDRPEQKARLFLAMLDGVALHYLCIFESYSLSAMKPELLRAAQNLCQTENRE